MLVKYVIDNGWTEHDLAASGDRTSTNFINSVAQCNGDLNNEQFFELIKKYIILRIEHLGKFKLQKLLDLFKFFKHFNDKELKTLLENALDLK